MIQMCGGWVDETMCDDKERKNIKINRKIKKMS